MSSSFSLRLLKWFCPPSLYEGVEGDLLEQFSIDVQRGGERKAQWNLFWNVLKFFRPGIIFRNKVHLSGHPLMASHFKVAWRSMVRNRVYTFVNIAGLTLGLTVALVLFWIVRFEHSFDKFHQNTDRLYQIITHDRFGGTSSHVPQGVIYALKNQFPEVEKASVVYGWVPQVIRVGNENLEPGNTFFAHPEFLEMIDIEWISGSVETSLSKPHQVVLDEPTAKRLFHDENPLGKVIRYDNTMDLTVSGIIKKMPVSSMFQMPFIMSYETLTSYMPSYKNENHWGGGDSWFHGYVLLEPGADVETIEKELASMVREHEASTTYTRFEFSKITDAHFDLKNDPFNYVVPAWMVKVLISIAFFMIIIACINFVNLATAQILQRSREVGMRKVMGSGRSSISFQFLTETGVLVGCSAVLASLMATVLVDYANIFFSTQVTSKSVWDTEMIFIVIASVVTITSLGGLYPAVIFSRFKPTNVFRSQLASFSAKGVTLRKVMVVTQFVIAQVMVICMVIGVQQVKFFYNTDLGFDKNAVITVNMVHKDSVLLQERFQQELLQYPEIKMITYGLTSPSSTRNWWWGNTSNAKLPDGEEQFRLQWIDENYLDFYGISLVAGRNFIPTDTTPVALINERVVQEMGLSDPEMALGEAFTYWGGNTVTVIGVVSNYHSQGLKSDIPPHLFMNGKWNFQLAQIKIDPLQSASAIQHIEQIWQRLHPDNYFQYEFLSDDLSSFYEDERRLSNFIVIFALVSLGIGCLGLFGLVSFVCARRTKEVSIRKVLGATVVNVLSLLSYDFVVLVVVAFVIAVPAGWYLMSEFLQTYEHQVDIHWTVFALSGMVTLAVTLLTVVARSLGVAFVNPANNLKYE